MAYPNLFSPITLRGMTAPNRIQRTSMVSGLATEDGLVTDALIARYQREARGGVGMLMVEASVILPSRSSFNLRISDDAHTDGLRRLVDEIRAASPQTRIGIQIMHFLKVSRSGWRQRVEDFRLEDLPVIVDQHVAAARRAVAAGFDFIELHMAHAYTLSSFISRSNGRADDYGGKLVNRMRLPTEVYRAVRAEVGEAYPLGIRINGEDFTASGSTLLQSTKVARHFAGLGVDYISVSGGSRFEDSLPPAENMPPDPLSGYSGQRMSPAWWFPDDTQIHLATAVRAHLRAARLEVPVVCAGKIRIPQDAERILEEGKSDIIGLCRALLCDPDWPNKASADAAKEIVHCTACNWCIEADSRYEQVTCSRWPEGVLVAPTPFTAKVARPSQLPEGVSL